MKMIRTRTINLLKTTTLVALPAAAVTLLLAAGNSSTSSQAEQAERIERGKYLVTIAACSDCHTPKKPGPNGPEDDESRWLSGHPQETQLPPPDLKPGPWFTATAGLTARVGPWGISYSANLTPDVHTGLGIWTEEMFIKAMRTGKHMGEGRDILPPMPWPNFSKFTDEDLKSIFAYLRSIPQESNRVPDPIPPQGKPQFQ